MSCRNVKDFSDFDKNHSLEDAIMIDSVSRERLLKDHSEMFQSSNYSHLKLVNEEDKTIQELLKEQPYHFFNLILFNMSKQVVLDQQIFTSYDNLIDTLQRIEFDFEKNYARVPMWLLDAQEVCIVVTERICTMNCKVEPLNIVFKHKLFDYLNFNFREKLLDFLSNRKVLAKQVVNEKV